MNREREYNLDLLRIVAMLMIITLHFLGKGGVLASPLMGHRYDIAWVIESICIVAVNCYVLISGYFLVSSKFKVSKLLLLLAQVLFYSLFVSALLLATHRIELTPVTMITTLFPTLTGQYWFITAYVGMYILSPFLNVLIEHLKKTQHLSLALILVFLFCIWPSIFWKSDVAYHIANGYSVVWFVVLYVIASYIRKYYHPDHRLARHLIRYAIVSAGIAISSLVLSYGYKKTNLIDFQTARDSLFAYNSVTTLIASLMLFAVFINMRIFNITMNKVIAFLAPLTFGVYLLHEHPLLRGQLWIKIFSHSTLDETHLALFALLVIPSVYLVGSLVDFIRVKIFILIGSWSVFKNTYANAEKHAKVHTRRFFALVGN